MNVPIEIAWIDDVLFARAGQLVIRHDGAGFRAGLLCAHSDARTHAEQIAADLAYRDRRRESGAAAAYHRAFRARKKALRLEAGNA